MRGILLGLADVLSLLLHLFQILVFVHWALWLVSADPANPVVRFVRALMDPVLKWLRRSLPFLVQGAWDLSPLAALLIGAFLKKALVYNLQVLAARF